MLRILGIVLAALCSLIVVVVLTGYGLPKKHVAARAITLPRQPEEVFALISNFAGGPAWRTGLQRVEMLPPRNGHICFREKDKNGAITMEVAESNPPERLVTRIADSNLPFGGSWIFEISPVAAGSRLNITERGEI
jgi:uncharacterized protein YndB with AHSA1/START domain